MKKIQIKKIKHFCFERIFSPVKRFYLAKILPVLKDPLFCSYWDIYQGGGNINNNQLSVRSGVYGKVFKYTQKGSAHMAVEDLFVGVMPLVHGRPAGGNFKVFLEKENKTLEIIIAKGIERSGIGNVWLSEAMCGFVRDSVQWLSSSGGMFYEIVYKRDSKGGIESFSLVSVSEKGIFNFFGNYYQVITWGTARKRRIKAQIIKIPKNKIFKISFPRELGGKRKIIKTWKRLWQLSNVIIPEFVMQSMEENKDIGYNSSDYHNSKDLEIAQATKHLGWDMRGGLNKLTLEYHTLYSFLKSEKAKAILREHILKSLNGILNDEILDFQTEIKIEGLPDVELIDKKMKDLLKGDVSFMDIYNSFKY